ncbi:MAG: STAS domain-containing protein [Fibrobacterota bacterium]|nr:STAS domain-containing protein [Fibrobacterota bacterium]QQS03175.1 MAG: STAS domain-containing protein [Fibrobacterota bacterium]
MASQPPRTYRSGQWMVVECPTGLDATDSAWMREILGQVRDSTWTGVVLDFSGVKGMDSSGRRLLGNFHKGLSEHGRALELVADLPSLQNEFFQESAYTVVNDLSELKRSIHEMAPERLSALLASGVRTGNLLGFRLRCPVCRCDEVRGWIPDPSKHVRQWVDHEITPQQLPAHPEDALAVDAYSVAVCPECLFASSRVDWFDFTGGHLPATLPEGSIDRLAKGFARRRAIVQDQSMDIPTHVMFGMPRLDRAVQCAWALAEESLRSVGRDRSSTDGFGIAVALLMQAKFAREGEDLARFYSAAYVWLRQVSEMVGNYAEDRMAEDHVYLLSVAFALGRETEAIQVGRQIVERWGKDPDMEFWVERSRELLR